MREVKILNIIIFKGLSDREKGVFIKGLINNLDPRVLKFYSTRKLLLYQLNY